MPFVTSNSLSANDANNMYRGLYRDNTDRSTSGTGEDTLGSLSIGANTIGATGLIHVMVAGSITGAAGNKTIKLKFGGSNVVVTATAAGTSDWYMEAWIHNTSTSVQRCFVTWSDHQSVTNFNKDFFSLAIDTTASATLSVTGECANGADVITESMFWVEIQQIS